MIYKTERVEKMISNGAKAEELFLEVMETLKKPIKRSTEEQNKFDHIDFFIGTKSYDVKFRDHVDFVWLEARGNYGYKGWLLGKADYIVMFYGQLQQFVFYKRLDLLNYAKQFKDKSEQKKLFHWRTRSKWGRKDLCLLVRKSDIEPLEIYTITISEPYSK